MRVVFRNIARSLFVVIFIAGGAALAVRGQGREANVISARAGGVNFVAGDVSVRTKRETAWQALTTKDDVTSGDTVKTGAGAQVEVLLNPGSYIRVGANSEFTLADDTLENLRIRLARGSAVIEAAGFDGLDVSLVVVTPQTEVSIVRSGVYRLNVLPTNVTEVAVEKGRALVGSEHTIIRGGRIARIGGSGLDVAKFDKQNRDELDLWSRERAKMLAEANRKLSRRSVNALLASADWANIFGAQRDLFGFDLTSRDLRTFGIWYFDPGRRCYTFLPGNYGWSSPYGYGYGNSVYFGGWGDPANQCPNCGLNNQVVVGGNGSNGGMGGSGSGNNGGGNSGGGGNTGGGTPNPVPSVRPEPVPREFSRPSFDQPRTVEGPRSQPATPVRDQ